MDYKKHDYVKVLGAENAVVVNPPYEKDGQQVIDVYSMRGGLRPEPVALVTLIRRL